MAGLRRELVAAVLAAIERHQGTWLIGLPGAGKTELLGQLVHRLELMGRRTLVLRGIEAWRDRPFSTLFSAVHGEAPASGSPISAAMAWLAARSSATSVILIDDVDCADLASLGAIAAMPPESRPVVVITSTVGRSQLAQRAVSALGWRGGRTLIPQLHHEELHSLLETVVFPGPDAQLVSQILVASGGLPGLAKAVAMEAASAGAVRSAESGWTIDGSLWRPSVCATTDGYLVDLNEQVLTALETLAMVGPVTVAEARSLVDHRSLAVLERRGLLEVFHSTETSTLTVFPPLLARSLQENAPSTGRTVVSGEELPRVITTKARTRGLQDPWTTVHGSSSLVLAHLVRELGAGPLAEYRRAWEKTHAAEQAVDYILALHEMSRGWPDIDKVLVNTHPTNGDLGPVLITMRALATAALTQGTGDGIGHLMDASREHPRHAAFLRGTAAHLSLISGVIPDPCLLEPPEPEEHPYGAESVTSAFASTLLASGDPESAEEMAATLQPEYGFHRLSRDVTTVMSLLMQGQVCESLRVAAHALEQGRERLEVSSITAQAFSAGLALWLSGRHDDLRAHLGSVLSLGPAPVMQTHYQVGLLNVAILDATMRGQTGYASALQARREQLSPPCGAFPAMNLALGLNERAEGRPGEWWTRLQFEASYCTPLQAPFMNFWSALAGAPRPVLADHPEPKARTLQLMNQAAEALRDAIPETLVEIADQLCDIEFHLPSALLRVRACMLMLQEGRQRECALAAGKAWSVMAHTQLDRTIVFAPLAAAIDLTERERQIGLLVQQGQSNSDVAQSLVLSVRTVENHMQSAFRKVGVMSREELGRALQTWLAHDPA